MLLRSILFVFLCAPTFLCAQIDFSQKNPLQHELLKQLEAKIAQGDFENITSVLIARDGKLIYEKYFNGATVDSRHNTRSATKTLATILTGMAITDGHLNSEEDRIFDYLKPAQPVKNPHPKKEQITVEDLLTMSSVLECDDNNQFSRGNEERMYIVGDWLQFFVDLPIRGYPYSPKPEDSPYGRAMSYCSAGSATVAEVVQAAVGMPAHVYMQNKLFKPLDIGEFTLHFSPTGTLNTAGGSEYRSRDLLKFIQLLLQKGKWEDQQLIEEAWVEKATSPKATAWPGMNYGYLLWMKPFGNDKKIPAFAMAGNGGQKLLALPDLNTTVVITTTNYGNRKAHGYTDEMMNDFIVPALLN